MWLASLGWGDQTGGGQGFQVFVVVIHLLQRGELGIDFSQLVYRNRPCMDQIKQSAESQLVCGKEGVDVWKYGGAKRG